jgi:hypothetical protein
MRRTRTICACDEYDRNLMEDKPARFTILIDAERKKAFDELCASQDVTSSQMIRRLIRDYLAKHGVEEVPRAVRARKQKRA